MPAARPPGPAAGDDPDGRPATRTVLRRRSAPHWPRRRSAARLPDCAAGAGRSPSQPRRWAGTGQPGRHWRARLDGLPTREGQPRRRATAPRRPARPRPAGDASQKRRAATCVCGARPPGAPSVMHHTLGPDRSGTYRTTQPAYAAYARHGMRAKNAAHHTRPRRWGRAHELMLVSGGLGPVAPWPPIRGTANSATIRLGRRLTIEATVKL